MSKKKKFRIRTSVGEKIFKAVNYTIITLLALICLYPFWHVVMASFSDGTALMGHQGLLLKPLDFTWDAYKRVLENENLFIGLKNTLYYLVFGVSWSMLMSCLGAYVLSRKELLLRRPLMLMIMFTMFFSGGTIPTYLNIQELGMMDSLIGLILPFSISTYNMIILRTSFESVPESLVEAAKIDGAGQLTVLSKIVLPLSKATLVTVTMYYGVATWNAWFWASTILQDRTKMPLSVFLRETLIMHNMSGMDSGMPTSESIKYAIIVVSTVPMLLIYPFIQRYFTKGVMVGAVKE